MDRSFTAGDDYKDHMNKSRVAFFRRLVKGGMSSFDLQGQQVP
jgi:hypothetical protein